MNYTIKSKNVTLTVRSLGAEIISLKCNNIEYMHQANKATWNRTAPYLFPNIGTINNGYKTIDNNYVKMVKHGFLRDSELTLVNKKNDELTFEYNNVKGSSLLYPISFKLLINYKLTASGVKASITVTNVDSVTLPFNFGLHPAFRVPLLDTEKFEDYEVILPAERTYVIPTVDANTGCVDWTHPHTKEIHTLPLNYADYKDDAIILEPFMDKYVTLKSTKSNYGIKFEFDNFKTLGIWTPNHVQANFICLEPWIGCGDAPDSSASIYDKKDIIVLHENEVWKANYLITCLF